MADGGRRWLLAHVVLLLVTDRCRSQGPLSCVIPFYESEGQCVETCPDFHYGELDSQTNCITCNGHCEPFPSEYQVRINATKYVAEILRETPVGTPIIYLAVSINVTHFQNLQSVSLDIVRNQLVESTFNFDGGGTSLSFTYGDSNPIDPDINATLVIEHSIVYAQAVGVDAYTFDIIVAVTGMMDDLTPVNKQVLSEATVIVTELCGPNPCQNGGDCLPNPSALEFTCACAAGYSGTLCDTDLDVCQLDTCASGGNCSEGAGADFTCNCRVGFAGDLCETDIDYCTLSTCLNAGTCIEGTGTLTSCSCPSGFNGSMCETDLDFCAPDSCTNRGNCSEGPGEVITCQCLDGYGGAACEINIDLCLSEPCQNGANCTDGEGTSFTCTCLDGFNGSICDNDLDFCVPDSCTGNGNCTEGYGAQFSCSCFEGYSGQYCQNDLDFCSFTTCLNGGTCLEGNGTLTTCVCVEGYNGTSCDEDLDFCQSITDCSNGGTCVEGPGTDTSCECPPGYTGLMCETDQDFCSADTCSNGGTCVEGNGTETTCTCVGGFSGELCELDLDFCDHDTCLNGGTCSEGVGMETSCICSSGFTGLNCSIDLQFCTAETCQNNGTCIEGLGEQVSCNCSLGYTGANCEDDDTRYMACGPDSCENGGGCNEEFGPETSCNCTSGFAGARCEDDLEFCSIGTCENGGTCVEGYGPQTMCVCAMGFSGPACGDDLDFCANQSCLNNATCSELYGPGISCDCPPGFSGSRCETDLDFCLQTSCLNGGTCTEGVGLQTRCLCLPDFTAGDCSQLMEPCRPGLYYSGGQCVEQCPENRYGEFSSRICTPLASGYRVSFNATFYMATIAAATALGTPVINFTVYFDPTYFQSFEAVVLNLVQLSSTGRSAFSLENGESTNVITFADDGSSLVLTVLSRTIHYSEVIAAGEYELSLSVTVVGQRGSDVESVQEVRSSLVRIGVEGPIPEGTAESSKDDEFELDTSIPSDNLFFWIAVGVAALMILGLLVCVLVCVCYSCTKCNGHKKRKYVIQENPYVIVNDTMASQKAPEVMLKTNYSPTPLDVNEPDNDGYFAGVMSQPQEQMTSFSGPPPVGPPLGRPGTSTPVSAGYPRSQSPVHPPLPPNMPLPMTLLLQTPETNRRILNQQRVRTEGSFV